MSDWEWAWLIGMLLLMQFNSFMLMLRVMKIERKLDV